MSKKSKKMKATSLLPMSTTIGFIIGFFLGAAGGAVIVGLLAGVIIGAGIGYYIDKKNGIHYGKKH